MNRTMAKTTQSVFVVSALALTLAGCGGGGTSQASSGTGDAPTSEASIVDETESVKEVVGSDATSTGAVSDSATKESKFTESVNLDAVSAQDIYAIAEEKGIGGSKGYMALYDSNAGGRNGSGAILGDDYIVYISVPITKDGVVDAVFSVYPQGTSQYKEVQGNIDRVIKQHESGLDNCYDYYIKQ